MSKTIKVEEVKATANKMLKSSKLSQDFKKGVCAMIEQVLRDSGNYAGFGYPYWNETGYKLWKAEGEPGFPEKQKYIGNEYDRQYF